MNNTPLFTEKSYDEAMRPLINYDGDDNYVKGSIYAMANGGDPFKYASNYNAYKQALEDSKANDNDNFWSGLGDFFVGKSAERQKADLADEYLKAYSSNPFAFDSGSYNDAGGKIKTDADLDRGTFINGGLLGALINPITQTVKAGVDLGAGAIGSMNGDENAWDAWNKRDHLSDLGALANTALTFTGAGNLARGASLGSKIAVGALAGGLQNGAYNLYENGQNTDMGNLLGDMAFGAAIGGAIPVAGNALGNITSKGATRLVDSAVARNGLNLTDDAYLAAINNAKSGIRGGLTSFGAGLMPTTKIGKAAALGGSAALGGLTLSNLLGGGSQPEYDDSYYNYYGGY